MVDWLQISQVSGSSGVYTVTVTASSTSELTARTTSLTVTAHAPAGGIWTDKTQNVSIRQRGTGELVVTPTVLNFVASGGSATIDITTYLGDWSLTGNDWLSFSQTTGGTGQTTVTVTAPDYSGDRRRIGSISITDGYSTVNVNVNQWGIFSVVPNSFTFPASGGTESFTVTSSRDWSITNVPAWITMSQVSGYNGTYTVTMTADTNTGAVRTDSFDVSDGYSTVNCSVSQDIRELIVTPTIFVFPYSASTSTLLIDAPDNWFINKDGQWFDFSSMSGTGYSVVTVSATTNTGSGARNSTFTVDDGQHTPISCTIGQSASGDTPTPTGESEYLTFKIVSSGTIIWSASHTAFTKTIEYKLNNGGWTSITSSTGSSAPIINVSQGDVIQFRGDNPTYGGFVAGNPDFLEASHFTSTTSFEVDGNIMSLVDSTGFATATTLTSSYTFCTLFMGCTGLTSADSLLLPATALTESCYASMFWACTSLTTAPELPATTLAQSCYADMFWACTSLTTAPELPATTLAEGCYNGMFGNCTSLTTAPELPATTLPQWCYTSMFYNCSSLTTAPELPATRLSRECYKAMFGGCTSLNYIKCLATTNISGNTANWVQGVSANGTFVKDASTTLYYDWTFGQSGIPSGWTVQDA